VLFFFKPTYISTTLANRLVPSHNQHSAPRSLKGKKGNPERRIIDWKDYKVGEEAGTSAKGIYVFTQ